MPKEPEDDNPEVSTDSPIVTVRRRMYWYRSGYQRARAGELVSLVSLLVLGGATTVSATVEAEAWLTASLAASGVVLNGLRSAFRWHDLGVSRLEAFESLEKTVKEYELSDRGGADPDRDRRLLDDMYAISALERHRWASWRTPKEPDHTASRK